MSEAKVVCRVSFTISAEFQTVVLAFEVEKGCSAAAIGKTADLVYKKAMAAQRKRLPGTVDKFAAGILGEGPKIRKAGKRVRGS